MAHLKVSIAITRSGPGILLGPHDSTNQIKRKGPLDRPNKGHQRVARLLRIVMVELFDRYRDAMVGRTSLYLDRPEQSGCNRGPAVRKLISTARHFGLGNRSDPVVMIDDDLRDLVGHGNEPCLQCRHARRTPPHGRADVLGKRAQQRQRCRAGLRRPSLALRMDRQPAIRSRHQRRLRRVAERQSMRPARARRHRHHQGPGRAGRGA